MDPEGKIALLRQHDEGVPWTRITAESGVSLRTLTRWATQDRADPTPHGLEPTRRTDSGRRRIPAELIEVIEALALRRPEPTAAYIHRRVSDIANERGLAVPSYSSVRAIIATIDPDLRTLAQHGHAAYRDQFELVASNNSPPPSTEPESRYQEGSLLGSICSKAAESSSSPGSALFSAAGSAS